ncbi:hypothetical protein GLOIN_2v1763333 [Rhizophagus clarus]|uniref:Uncharacterized protein n=1 Tax=Rhizophagus clarus TaxID=94130 RepID=A0A8H3M002_9GLOM|nr:hypothetical protein GLOIN_2v1763333 [Rhizophagus clarus]
MDNSPSLRIDWRATKKWLEYNSTDQLKESPTSDYHSALSGFKLKAMHHLLPIGDLLSRNFPQHLPPALLTCHLCLQTQETNKHLWLCPKHHDAITSALQEHKFILETLIRKHQADITQDFDLCIRIENWEFFKSFDDDSHLLYLLLHQIITEDITDFIHLFIQSHKTILTIVLEFAQSLFTHIVIPCWHLHNKSFHDYVKLHHLSVPSFSAHRSQKRKHLQNSSATNSTLQTTPSTSSALARSCTSILDKGFHRNFNSPLYKFTIPPCHFIKPQHFYSPRHFVFILACHFSKMVSPLGFLAFGLVGNSSWHEPWMLEILQDFRY